MWYNSTIGFLRFQLAAGNGEIKATKSKLPMVYETIWKVEFDHYYEECITNSFGDNANTICEYTSCKDLPQYEKQEYKNFFLVTSLKLQVRIPNFQIFDTVSCSEF